MTPNEPARPRLSEDEARWVTVWRAAEDVAMHFNDLIQNFRLKALGALSVGAGLIGTVLITSGEGPPVRINFMVLAGAMAFLALLWSAVCLVDVLYYQRLLQGAVKD